MESTVITADMVIRERQNELVAEIYLLNSNIAEMEKQLQDIRLLREKRIMEHSLLENNIERNSITITTTTVELSGDIVRKSSTQKAKFEDVLRQIFDVHGRPLRIGELINQLEQFGFMWSKYVSAHGYITQSGLVESTGKRGFYNIIRNRGW